MNTIMNGTNGFSSSERKFLYALLNSPNGELGIEDFERNSCFKRTWIYHLYNKLQPDFVSKKTMKGTRGYPITLFSLTEKGREKLLKTTPHTEISYVVDLGSEGEVTVLLDSPLVEDKFYYEAYWRTHAPSIAPLLKFLDFEKPINEIDVRVRIRIPKVSKEVLDAAYFFDYLDNEAMGEQGRFWWRNVEWMESLFGKEQEHGIWDTPSKDVYDACQLLIKDPKSVFLATMLGLKLVSSDVKHTKQLFSQGDIINLKLGPFNIFEYLLMLLPYLRKKKEISIGEDSALHLFNFLIETPEVREWINRCLRRDGRNWLMHIPFQMFGFQRDKELVQSSWIYDYSTMGLGVFASSKIEDWQHIGSIMHILLDTLMMKHYPSRLGDNLNCESYSDDLILRAWEKVRDFWKNDIKANPRLKREISLRYKKTYLSARFFQTQINLRNACFRLLDSIYEKWSRAEDSANTQTRELWSYFPGKTSPINESLAHVLDKKHILPPEKLSEYKALIRIINEKRKAFEEDRERPAIISKPKRKKPVIRETYDPSERTIEFLEKVDYDNFVNKISELAKKCPKHKDTTRGS